MKALRAKTNGKAVLGLSGGVDSAVAALSLRADGLFLYAHLLAEYLESAGGKIDFGKLDELPAGLGEVDSV